MKAILHIVLLSISALLLKTAKALPSPPSPPSSFDRPTRLAAFDPTPFNSSTPNVSPETEQIIIRLSGKYKNETYLQYWERHQEQYFQIIRVAHTTASDIARYKSSLLDVYFSDEEAFVDLCITDPKKIIAEIVKKFGQMRYLHKPGTGISSRIREDFAHVFAHNLVHQIVSKTDFNQTAMTLENLLNAPNVSATAFALAAKVGWSAWRHQQILIDTALRMMSFGFSIPGIKGVSEKANREVIYPLIGYQPMFEGDKIREKIVILREHLDRERALYAEELELTASTSSSSSGPIKNHHLDPNKYPFLSLPESFIRILDDFASSCEILNTLLPLIHPFDRLLLNKFYTFMIIYSRDAVVEFERHEEEGLVPTTDGIHPHVRPEYDRVISNMYFTQFMNTFRYVLMKNGWLTKFKPDEVDTNDDEFMVQIAHLVQVNKTNIDPRVESALTKLLPIDIQLLYGPNGTMPVAHVGYDGMMDSSAGIQLFILQQTFLAIRVELENVLPAFMSISNLRSTSLLSSSNIDDLSKIKFDVSVTKSDFPHLLTKIKNILYGSVPLPKSNLKLQVRDFNFTDLKTISTAIKVLETPYPIAEVANISSVRIAPRFDLEKLPRMPLPQWFLDAKKNGVVGSRTTPMDHDEWLGSGSGKAKSKSKSKSSSGKKSGAKKNGNAKSSGSNNNVREEEREEEGDVEQITGPAQVEQDEESIETVEEVKPVKPQKQRTAAPIAPSTGAKKNNNATKNVCETLDSTSGSARFSVFGKTVKKDDVQVLCSVFGYYGKVKWMKFVKMMTNLGFLFQTRGGSRTSFKDPANQRSLYVDSPHPGIELKKGMLKMVANVLTDFGVAPEGVRVV